MENINNNPVTEENVQTPVVGDAPVVIETPVAEETVVEIPVVVEPTPEPEKVEEVREEPAVVTTNDFSRSTKEPEAVGSVVDGAIGVTSAPKRIEKKSSKKKDEVKTTVAIHSTKNVTWQGVGKVYRGYNIVSEDAAEQWLTRSHIRIATPDEVAKEFGK